MRQNVLVLFMRLTTQNKTSPRQNRVDPLGHIISTKARGAWMGNRGNIHNDTQQIVRPYKLYAWLICQLQFKNRHRQIMAPNLYTELFFLDEATAFAAGHRPCFECRREDALCFKILWLQGNPEHGFTDRTSIQEIDNILHKERMQRDGTKAVYQASINDLSNGTFVLFEGNPYLLYDRQMHEWTPFGYEAAQALPQAEIVSVMTPQSIVNAFHAGYLPQINAIHAKP